MARKKRNLSFQEIFEEHPIKSCLGCFISGIAVSYTILTFLYNSKFENLKERYDDKIESLTRAHNQDLEIREIKLKKEEGTKYYLNIQPDSKLANDISNLIKKN
jgi:hypothetical protein